VKAHDALFMPMFCSLLVAMFGFFAVGILTGTAISTMKNDKDTERVFGNLNDAYAEDVLIVRNNLGGGIASYAQRWAAVTQMELSVVIDGECSSACTHVLWQVPEDRVCITKNAKFGFHLASIGGVALPELSTDLHRHYPLQVQEWLKTQELSVADVAYLPDDIARSLYRTCGDLEAIYGK
jgi:hypothetical protein